MELYTDVDCVSHTTLILHSKKISPPRYDTNPTMIFEALVNLLTAACCE